MKKFTTILARSRGGSFSANKLMAVELGFYLLSEVAPAQPYTVLPEILTGATELPKLSGKHERYVRRAKLLLGQYAEAELWRAHVVLYAELPEKLQAYDIDTNSGRFSLKRVGFSRGRVFTLKRLFD